MIMLFEHEVAYPREVRGFVPRKFHVQFKARFDRNHARKQDATTLYHLFHIKRAAEAETEGACARRESNPGHKHGEACMIPLHYERSRGLEFFTVWSALMKGVGRVGSKLALS